MRENKTLSLLIIILNVMGAACLIYFAVPYFIHDTAIANPDAMLPVEAWDRAGMALTFGFIPLLAVNVFIFLLVRVKQKCVRFLFLVPSAVCFAIVISYWIRSFI